jgi:PAS domain S-box-containing protein
MDPTGKITHFIAHEEIITKRKESEAALRHSEARYRSLVQGAPYGIYRSDIDGRFLDVNPALVAILGYDSEAELLALDPDRDVYQSAGDSRRLAERLLREHRVPDFEAHWKRKDGMRITVALRGRLVKDPGGAGSFEIMVENVTERRRLEGELQHSQRMEAVGRLAGGVAHDFNNLLTVIGGYVDFLQETVGPDSPMVGDITNIKNAADRAVALTRQLLAFSRRQMLQPVVLSLNEVVTDLEKILVRVIGEDVHLLTKLDPALGQVRADAGQIEQVIMNLVINARDALPEGGKVTVETANVELDEEYCRRHVAARPGHFVMISVSDDGCGMDEETRSRIFEPFFTTKERGKGTGLGLSTAYGIVKQSGGFIWVYSEPGQGTTFKIYLPRIEEAISRHAPTSTWSQALVGTETILLVEDEDAVRTLTGRILGQCGYRVLAAGNAAEALSLSERHEGPIDLMLTDVVMPQIERPRAGRALGGRAPGNEGPLHVRLR